MSKPVNILWLMSDQHNANCLGVEGHPDIRTPHLDALVGRGVRFTRAYCDNPICGPSRSCFLSGQYVKHHGISGNFIREVEREAPNLAALFREAGYQTALIGKAHLPKQWVEQGFEHVRLSDLADAAAEDPRTCHYFQELVDLGLADKYDSGWLPPGHPGHGMKSFVSELPEAQSLEVWTNREAVKFLQGRNPGQPFFLKVSFQRPHDPYAPPAACADWYDPAALHVPDTAIDFFERGFAGKPSFMREMCKEPKGSGYPYRSENPADLRQQMARYFTLISMIDREVGHILAEIERQGELENTIVAYVADHGDFAGEHGLVLKNLGIYESIHRIPFILAGPGLPSGRMVTAMIEGVDFFPTLAESAGLGLPEGLDGTSRLALARGESGVSGRAQTVCEWDFPVAPQSRVHAALDDRYRLVLYDELPEEGELYDHANDPGELNNLYDDRKYRPERERLETMIADYRKDALRVHSPHEDAAQRSLVEDMPTRKIHARGWRWSQLQNELIPVR